VACATIDAKLEDGLFQSFFSTRKHLAKRSYYFMLGLGFTLNNP
jgi:hypothetical protein